MKTAINPSIGSRLLYPFLLFLFFLSGALGLGYQVLWSKYLLNFIGISAYSYATVLASFMAGLAIGSWFIGKLVDRVESPLKIYAYLELGIAAYALLYVPLTHQVAMLYASFVRFSPAGADALASYTDQENTDDNLFLEYRAPRDLFQSSLPTILNAMDERLISSPSLFWVQYSKFVSKPSLDFIKLLDEGVGMPNATRALQLAYYYLNGGSLDGANPQTLALLPASFISQPPLTDAVLAEKMDGLLKTGRAAAVPSLLNPNMPALCLLSAVSPEHSKLWLNKSEEWSQLKLPADNHKNILQFRVDLCLATGDLKSAETLLNELIHDADPPPFLWSILRTSEIDHVRLRLEILNAYRRPQDLPTILQFITLTASR